MFMGERFIGNVGGRLKRGGKGSGHVETMAGELPRERRHREKSHGTREMGFRVQDEGHKETARQAPTRLLGPYAFIMRSFGADRSIGAFDERHQKIARHRWREMTY
jgi:hypothetical protein